MAYETINVDVTDYVATITLDRPDAMNALNQKLLSEVCHALEDADASDKVRCIIITGSPKAFAAGADITEMAEQSFVDMFTNGIGGTQRLTRFVGKSKAMDMHLTGRFMDAEEAERSGLVSRVVPAKKLMDEARAAAVKITEKSQIATIAAKDAVNRSYETTLAEGINYERRMFQSLFATEDQSEGMAAFQEKREAQFLARINRF